MIIATQNVDYIQNQQVVTLSLNAGATVSVTFLIDTIAFEPDETFVLELSVTSITPAASVPLLDASLINVFFQRRQNFIIQDSTGISIIDALCIYSIYRIARNFRGTYNFVEKHFVTQHNVRGMTAYRKPRL